MGFDHALTPFAFSEVASANMQSSGLVRHSCSNSAFLDTDAESSESSIIPKDSPIVSL